MEGGTVSCRNLPLLKAALNVSLPPLLCVSQVQGSDKQWKEAPVFCRLLCSRYFRAMVGRLLSPLLLADLIRWKQKFLPPPSLGCFRINNSAAAVQSGLCGTSNVSGKEAPWGALETVIKVPSFSQGCISRVRRYQNSSTTPKFH